MTDKIYTIDEIRSNISPIAKKYGERVYLFGFYARGDATKCSDIDFRVDSGSAVRRQGGTAAALMRIPSGLFFIA